MTRAAVKRLFAPPYPNLAFVHAVLEGRIPGEVWEGRAPDGGPIVLVTTGSPYCFVGGDVTLPVLESVVERVRGDRPRVLVHPPGLVVTDGTLPTGTSLGRRVQFMSVPGHPEPPYDPLPAGFTRERITDARFAEVGWGDMVGAIFGSAENYVRHHHGFAILHGGDLVAEAHSVVGGGFAEVGIHTHPDYRRLGLSWLALSELVRFGLREGLEVVATFDVDATANRRLAHRLGLQGEREYGVLLGAAV